MRLSLNVIMQMVGLFVQGANGSGVLGEDHTQQTIVAIIVAAFQLLGAIRAHYSNPDGTPAEASYRPPQ